MPNPKAQSKELTRLTEKIQDSFEKNNVCVDSTMNNDFIHLMHEMTETVHSENPEGSFKRIFWDQQLSANRVKNVNQIRWLASSNYQMVLTIKWLQSNGAYT